MTALLTPHVPLVRRPRAARPAQAPLGPERRHAPRIPQPPLHVAGMDATVDDVSEGGICLRTRGSLEVGERYCLILTEGTCYYTRELVAEVQWSRGGLAGLLWVDLTPADREWLCSRFAQWPGRRRLRFTHRPLVGQPARVRVAFRVRPTPDRVTLQPRTRR